MPIRGPAWTVAEVTVLTDMVNQRKSMREIADCLPGRSACACQQHVYKLGLLKMPDKSMRQIIEEVSRERLVSVDVLTRRPKKGGGGPVRELRARAEAIVRMKRAGHRITSIARFLHRTPQTVYRVYERAAT